MEHKTIAEATFKATALHFAALNGHEGVVRVLLGVGVCVAAKENYFVDLILQGDSGWFMLWRKVRGLRVESSGIVVEGLGIQDEGEEGIH